MNSVIHRRETCRLCGGTDHELILSLKPSPICDAYQVMTNDPKEQELFPMDLFLCKTCGGSQILDVIDPEALYRDYIYLSTSSMGLSDHFKSYAYSVYTKLGLQSSDLIVDIGSNDGTLLGHFKTLGAKVVGVEPAREIAKQAIESGIHTYPEFFNKSFANRIREEQGKAKLVTMNNLFANVDDIDSVVDGISDLLSSDGVYVFETFYFLDYVQNLVFDFMYHEHLSYFSVYPLSQYFSKKNMELFDIERVSTKGGSLRCFVQFKNGPYCKTAIVDKMIENEHKKGLLQNGQLLENFRDRIRRCGDWLNHRLDQYQKDGKSIVGFGASATTTTFVYHYGLQDRFEYLVDDNPAKQYTLSPGCHLRVFPSSILYENNPDVVVIIAWRYADAIIRANQAFLNSGGTFIVPLPEPRIISETDAQAM